MPVNNRSCEASRKSRGSLDVGGSVEKDEQQTSRIEWLMLLPSANKLVSKVIDRRRLYGRVELPPPALFSTIICYRISRCLIDRYVDV